MLRSTSVRRGEDIPGQRPEYFMAVLLDGHMWLWVNMPQFDVSWSHGRKGSPFDVHCRQYNAVVHQFRNVLGCTARQIHVGKWSNALRLELYILLSTVGWVAPLVSVANSAL